MKIIFTILLLAIPSLSYSETQSEEETAIRQSIVDVVRDNLGFVVRDVTLNKPENLLRMASIDGVSFDFSEAHITTENGFGLNCSVHQAKKGISSHDYILKDCKIWRNLWSRGDFHKYLW